MQTMVERQAFFCASQVECVCFGEELNRSGSDRCSENKMCFETIVPLSNYGVFALFPTFSSPVHSKTSKTFVFLREYYQSPLMLGVVSSKGLTHFGFHD